MSQWRQKANDQSTKCRRLRRFSDFDAEPVGSRALSWSAGRCFLSAEGDEAPLKPLCNFPSFARFLSAAHRRADQNMQPMPSSPPMENRHGLAVAGMVTLANGTAERRASETMLKAKAKQVGRRITVGEEAPTMSPSCAPSTSPRMWHRTKASPQPASVAAAPSTATPRGTKATACRNHAGR